MTQGSFKKGSTAHRALAKRRRMLGLTQHQVAQATGIPVNKIVFAETGRCILEPSELDAIRSVLKARAREVTKELALA
jgi:transcriptional regulator with XRE-family HTH domain